jgi:hypothetical protein
LTSGTVEEDGKQWVGGLMLVCRFNLISFRCAETLLG